MDSCEETFDIVIVGGGIGGLATALALHRKGFRSIVLEKSECLRATGAAITILTNGWRALDQLGVSSQLRHTAIHIERAFDIWIDNGKQQEIPFVTGEARCLKRSELVKTLADALPHGTIRFGCQVVSIKMDHETKYLTLQFHDGKSIRAKVVIGCDGSKSKVADYLELKPPKQFEVCAIRGITNYPNGHKFPNEFIRMRRGKISTGRIPMTNNLVYWFIVLHLPPSDVKFPQDPELIKLSAMKLMDGFPADVQEQIQLTDLDSLSFTHLWYRAPWDILLGQLRKGTVTLVGDSMHVMGPFLGQGGSATLEDAVVLARNLSQQQCGKHTMMMIDKVEYGLDRYVKERRMRVVRLSTQSYLNGVVIESVSLVTKFVAIVLMVTLFRDQIAHTTYDCGRL